MYGVVWWLPCVWVPQVVENPAKSLQTFDQAHVDLISWNYWQRGFLHNLVHSGLYHFLLRLLEIRLRLLQCLHRFFSRFDRVTKPGPCLVHFLAQGLRLSPPAAPCFPTFQHIRRATPPPLPVLAAAEPAQEPGLSPSA